MKLTREVIAELQLAAKFTMASRLAPHEANLWFRWTDGRVTVGATSADLAFKSILPESDTPPFTGDLGVASGKFIDAINSLPTGAEAEIVFTDRAITVTAKPRTRRVMQVETSADSHLFPTIAPIDGHEVHIAKTSQFATQIISGSSCSAGPKDGGRGSLGNTGFIFGIESTIRSTNGFILVSQPILETYPEKFEFQLNKRSTMLLSMLFKGCDGLMTVGPQRVRVASGDRVASFAVSTNALPDFTPLFNQRPRSILRLKSSDIQTAVGAVRLGLDKIPKAYLAPEDGGFTISATSAEGEASEFLPAEFEEWNEPKDRLCIQARMFAQAARFIEGEIRLEVTEQNNLVFSSASEGLKPKFVVSGMKE